MGGGRKFLTGSSHLLLSSCRWSGFLLCAFAMLLVIFPMFTFPKKLPPRHKKKKRRKKLSLDDMSSDDDVLKEKSNNKSQPVTSSMGFGKDIKGGVSSSSGAPDQLVLNDLSR